MNDKTFAWVQRLFGEGDTITTNRFAWRIALMPQLEKRRPLSPELQLVLAVLENTFDTMQERVRLHNRCLEKYRTRGILTSKQRNHLQKLRAPFQEEYDWFFAKNDPNPFSFEMICSYLDIETGYIHRLLPYLLKQPAYTFADIEMQ